MTVSNALDIYLMHYQWQQNELTSEKNGNYVKCLLFCFFAGAGCSDLLQYFYIVKYFSTCDD
jgi:hypothetical protein